MELGWGGAGVVWRGGCCGRSSVTPHALPSPLLLGCSCVKDPALAPSNPSRRLTALLLTLTAPSLPHLAALPPLDPPGPFPVFTHPNRSFKSLILTHNPRQIMKRRISEHEDLAYLSEVSG